jgi:hypothetical protein
MSPVLRASPHERRCSPSSQVSPGLLTTVASQPLAFNGVCGIGGVLLEIDRDLVDLHRLEAGNGNVEALLDEELGQLGELDGKALPIPARIFGDLVVGQEQCALLGLTQPFENNRRHLVEVEIDRGRMSTMPQQDRVDLIDYDGDHEAEGENAIGDLADLLL